MCGLVLKLNVESEEGLDKTKVIIKNQLPKQGITAEKGGTVLCDI